MIFLGLDGLRQVQARWLDLIGYAPEPSASWIVLEMPGLRLRAFAERPVEGPTVVLVPAPIKRAGIFDLVPHASVARRCCEAGFCVFLVEWTDPAGSSAEHGLADYADRLLGEAVRAAGLVAGGDRAVLIGHSLGGTMAAIHAARRPDSVAGLLLLEAPLIFDPGIDAFAPWLRTPPAARRLLARAGTVPGSELSLAAVAAAPEAFVWHRWSDALASLSDPVRHDLHMRVLRWSLDEMALPSPLLREVLERLYRENRLRDGRLEISGRVIGLSDIRAPVLAVVERDSRVVPREDVLPALERTSSPRRLALTYDGEPGVALAHVGVLVGPDAHRFLWPRLLEWVAEIAA